MSTRGKNKEARCKPQASLASVSLFQAPGEKREGEGDGTKTRRDSPPSFSSHRPLLRASLQEPGTG